MTRATPVLSTLIADLIATAAVSRAATLGGVREVVAGDGIFLSAEGELLHPQDRTSLVIELDELIDSHGVQAHACDFAACPKTHPA